MSSADFEDADTIVARLAERSSAPRQSAYLAEIRRIIDATLVVVSRSGKHPNIREIVAEAGISSQTFYRHFRTKDELFLVLIDDARKRFRQHFRERMIEAGAAPDAVLEWVDAALEIATDPDAMERYHPFLAAIDQLTGELREELQRSEDLLVEQLESAIIEAVRLGACQSSDPTRDAAAIYRLTFSLVHDAVRAQQPPAAAERAHLADLVRRILRITPREQDTLIES